MSGRGKPTDYYYQTLQFPTALRSFIMYCLQALAILPQSHHSHNIVCYNWAAQNPLDAMYPSTKRQTKLATICW